MGFIIFLIVLLPIFAVTKVISEETKLPPHLVFWYGISFLVSAFIAFDDGLNEGVSIFIFACAIHLGLKCLVKILGWSVDTLNK